MLRKNMAFIKITALCVITYKTTYWCWNANSKHVLAKTGVFEEHISTAEAIILKHDYNLSANTKFSEYQMDGQTSDEMIPRVYLYLAITS